MMMGPRDVIRSIVESNDTVIKTYLQDLTDTDLLTRPVGGANHIAWQLGHLINAEEELLKIIPGAATVRLPEGWDKQHGKENAAKEPPVGYRTKAEYLELYAKVRENTKKVLATLSDADLDKPTTGRLAKFAPTWGALLVLIANHSMMHAGQIAVLRRKLGKPIVM
jgi:uncharacterized damage-inducible protein DinB